MTTFQELIATVTAPPETGRAYLLLVTEQTPRTVTPYGASTDVMVATGHLSPRPGDMLYVRRPQGVLGRLAWVSAYEWNEIAWSDPLMRDRYAKGGWRVDGERLGLWIMQASGADDGWITIPPTAEEVAPCN